MVDAGHGKTLPDGRREPPPDPEIERIADAYVAAALGDVRLALRMSVAEGVTVSLLVSRGFARWGQPALRRRR